MLRCSRRRRLFCLDKTVCVSALGPIGRKSSWPSVARSRRCGLSSQMKTMWVRIDSPSAAGSLWIDDVRLEEAELLDPWQSWQSQGTDQHSLGGRPVVSSMPRRTIIGCARNRPPGSSGSSPSRSTRSAPTPDPLRASWPIVEAEGAREKPLTAASGRGGTATVRDHGPGGRG